MSQRSILYFLIFTSLIAQCPHAWAQLDERDSLVKAERDSIHKAYINEYHDKFYIKPILTSRNLNLELQNRDNQINDIEYKPNGTAYFGLGLYFFDIGLEVAIKLPDETGRDAEIFGETDIFDFQTNIYSKKWGADIAYQRYSGFYLEDPDRHIPSWNRGDPFPQRDDLRLFNFQLNVFYIFNHNRFSFRSAYNQSDRQLRSSGSFLMNLFTGTTTFRADSILIPEEELMFFGDEGRLDFGRFSTLALLPGYTHNFIIDRFYLNASLSVGPGHLWVRHDVDDRIKNDINIKPVVNLRTAVGYNSDSFFGGLSFVSQNVNATIGELDVRSFSGNFKVFMGYRFQEKGFLTKKLF
ncbi:MAG: DUF4421 family protein [Bacteroidota bacterium]